MCTVFWNGAYERGSHIQYVKIYFVGGSKPMHSTIKPRIIVPDIRTEQVCNTDPLSTSVMTSNLKMASKVVDLKPLEKYLFWSIESLAL